MTFPTSPSAELDPLAKRALLADLLQERLDATRVEAVLTHGQQAMWFLHQLAPESGAYNVAFAARVRSAVDHGALQRALQALVDRHAPLRTTYGTRDGKPVQLIAARQNMELKTTDAATWDEATLYHQVNAVFRAPFDLEQGPLFRALLFTRGLDDHVLLLTAHHIAIDAWSVWVLLNELGAFYAAETTGSNVTLPPLAIQYADYARWQNALVAGEEGERMWDYWRTNLSGDLPVLDLPTDRPRPALQTFEGATIPLGFSDELSEGIRAFARSEQTTPYAVMLAAYQVLLHRYSGQEDILVGSPMAGRNRPEYAGLVGDFINTVVLRADLSGAPSFRAFVAQVRGSVLSALAHQEFPFALLVQRLAPKPDPSRSPIFQAAINFHNLHRTDLADLFAPDASGVRVDVGGLLLESYPLEQQEGQLDLMLQVIDANTLFVSRFQYNTDLFDAATIERMAGHYRALLEAAISDPDQSIASLPLLTAAEQAQLTTLWNATAEPHPECFAVHGLVEAQVDRTPNSVAVRFNGEALTYAQLEQSANQLAHLLRQRGIGPGVVVAVSLERSLEIPVALLGILKAGATYLPLDPTYPSERLAYILRDAAASALLTSSQLTPVEPPSGLMVLCLDELADELRQHQVTRLDGAVDPDDLAYVIYTSGSTGTPKGVEVPHRAVTNFLSTMSRRPGLTADDVLVAVTTPAFDIAALELFLPLIVGAEVVLADRETTRNGHALLKLLRDSSATVLQATPATFQMLLQGGLQEAHGLRCFCGGEAMPTALARALLAAGAELWNMYGPTETTIWSTVHAVEHVGAIIPIGRPIGNTQTYIFDSAMQLVPPGVIGELYIGGAGVARGYRNRPDLTAECFVPDPFTAEAGRCLYRTGDLARYLSDGTVVVLGRTDRQTKLRGYRIELGEIEAALATLQSVREAVVMVREDNPGDRRLIAYLTPSEGETPRPDELRAAARRQLPDYMAPSTFVILDTLPRTPNGKIDHRALPAPYESRVGSGPGYIAPNTATERTIADVWRGILSVERVSTLDYFFDLGGHSLQVMETIAAVERQLGVRLTPVFLQTQTLGQLAATCDEMLAKGEIRNSNPTTSVTQSVFGAMRRVLGAGSRQGAR